jgi:monoamine oxidase
MGNRPPAKCGRISRREALKVAGSVLSLDPRTAMALTSSVTNAASDVTPAQSRPTKKVIIAGAGIGGLSCAYELMKRGHEVTVIEAAGRAGGHVRTLHDPLADGLYADVGAEHFTQPGYDLYWKYVKEFDLPHLAYPRRDNMLRFIQGKMYTEEQLHDRSVLQAFGLNSREVDFLTRHPLEEFGLLFLGPYLDSFADEYQPFTAGLNDLDKITVTDLLKKDGASPAAIEFIGGPGSGYLVSAPASALHVAWYCAILKLRGVPLFPTKLFRIQGGNQIMTDTLASKLGDRLRLGCPVTAIEHGGSGVKVTFREFGREKQIEGDYLVSCISVAMLRQIPVTPEWPEDKGHVIREMPYLTVSRVVFQSRTPFWNKDRTSPNLQFSDPNLFHVWRTAEEVDTSRGLLLGAAVVSARAEDSAAAFRKWYPGKSEDIEQTLIWDWSSDPWAAACERTYYQPGVMAKFWPKTIEPHGKIHFAGAYADNLSWGQEAATRSAHRVAEAIDRA